MLYSIVALLVVIFDQAVKFWVTNNLLGYDVVSLIPGVISLVNVPNYGAAFGILSGGNARIGFIIVTVVFCLAVIIALATNFINGRVARWSLVMVAAGGFANCIDRVIYGYVVDMFKVELFNFAIFNVADIFITVFAIIFAISILFEKDSTVDEYDDDEDEDEEDEEEEDKPRRSGLLSRFRRSDEDDEEERPRRGKKAKFEDEYEEYKAKQRPSRPAAPAGSRPGTSARSADRSQGAPARSAAPSRNSDPFAEWEKANARVDAKRNGSYAARAMGTQSTQPSQGQARPVSQARPASPQQQAGGYRPPVQRPAQQGSVRPAQPSYSQASQQPQSVPQQPAPQAAPRPQTKPETSSDSEFNLDDILNEFK